MGANGRACDAGVFAASAMSAALENNELSIPPSSPLPGRVNDVPYVIVGDEAFGLKEHLMKPYPARNLGDFERIHNYRLSRARRVSENAFGILGKRFRILDQRMNLPADKCTTITNACIVLHNYLLSKHDTQYRENYATRDNNSNVTFANMSHSVPARLGKGQQAKEIGHNLAREQPKFGHNLVRKKHTKSFTHERPKFCLVGN